ncbi:facilitated trehalose transporter Tret1-like [Vespa crabro]|uniref:facilitated trehalose transporter Tret1-like n=1 Tax=Vespa crabro TaxID=7445 RepID=UPI001F00B5AF|nr:facilitated trehalose transporter Tret1-like [Vespa crabro]XP_046827165.1 facilitated trehalose transporter Tret1-like [Vespa crabro]
MAEKIVGFSQETLVSQTEQKIQTKRFLQYIASLAVSIGAIASGMSILWTSQAGTDGVNIATIYKIAVTPEEYSWIGSLAALGSAVVCVPIGTLADIVGRKYSMLMLVIPFTIGWLCIIFAKSVAFFYVGRFLTGFSGGAFCVTGPMYTSEIGESEIRGRLGTFYHLFQSVGVLLTAVLNLFDVNIYQLSIISGFIPIIFGIAFSFMPESPVYYLLKRNEDAARKIYIKLRGSQYDVEEELSMQKKMIEEVNKNKVSFLSLLKSKACKKAILISYGLMGFQQLSGVNAIVSYIGFIFETSGNFIGPKGAVVIISLISISMVFVSLLTVDRLGRKILLIISSLIMSLSNLALGIYFYFLETSSTDGLAWLPFLSVGSYIVSFAIGFGPLPWMMISEFFTPETKGIAGSSACLLNWILAFVVTKTFVNLNDIIHVYGTFWLFSLICALGVVFVLFFVPETKGKTLEQIQRELSA